MPIGLVLDYVVTNVKGFESQLYIKNRDEEKYNEINIVHSAL